MPNGLLDDVRLEPSKPVIAVVDADRLSRSVLHEAAAEAVARGAALDVVTLVPPAVPPRRPALAPGPDVPDDLLAEVRRRHPALHVTSHRLARTPAIVRHLSVDATLLVIAGQGEVATDLLRPAALSSGAGPVLVVDPGDGGRRSWRRTVVALTAGSPRDASSVVDAAVAAAARRGCDVLLVHHGPAARTAEALRELTTWTADVMQLLGLDVPADGVPRLVTLHTSGGNAELDIHARGVELTVLDGATATALGAGLRRLGSVLIVSRTTTHHEARLAVYRRALVDELARTEERPDGCTTAEELDDAWRLGISAPPVSERVLLAGRACLSCPQVPLTSTRRP